MEKLTVARPIIVEGKYDKIKLDSLLCAHVIPVDGFGLFKKEELASLLGGMVACTRPLVESNLFDAKRQIGLSGRTVKPKLIICIGISGAVQFAAGMRSSDCIVAINSDRAAPIFDVAHVCIPGDANEIIPMLIERIKEARHA